MAIFTFPPAAILSRTFLSLRIFSFALVLCSTSAHANDKPESNEKPHLLVVATAHFKGSTNDLVSQNVAGIASERRQAEIESFLSQVENFRPTRIAVEYPMSRQAELSKHYLAYLDGDPLSTNEIEQLGFRLARKLKHHDVYAVDWNGNPPGNFEESYDWGKYAEEHGQQGVIASLSDPAQVRKYSPPLEEQTITEWLGP